MPSPSPSPERKSSHPNKKATHTSKKSTHPIDNKLRSSASTPSHRDQTIKWDENLKTRDPESKPKKPVFVMGWHEDDKKD
jgi:hypothetical protein